MKSIEWEAQIGQAWNMLRGASIARARGERIDEARGAGIFLGVRFALARERIPKLQIPLLAMWPDL